MVSEYELEIEKHNKDIKNKMEQAQAYADSMDYINPEAIVLFRYTMPAISKGGLHLPTDVIQREGKSSLFGKILRISPLPSVEESVQFKKEKLKVGQWIMFLATNPIKGGLPDIYQCQLLAASDVLCTFSEEDFEKFIKSKEG